MVNTPAPSAGEILGFLRGLRQYRATLAGPAQILLDSLVTAGLDRCPEQRLPDEIRVPWAAYAEGSSGGRAGPGDPDVAAGWATTPWAAAYGLGVPVRPDSLAAGTTGA